jgi:hypothetical protein
MVYNTKEIEGVYSRVSRWRFSGLCQEKAVVEEALGRCWGIRMRG